MVVIIRISWYMCTCMVYMMYAYSNKLVQLINGLELSVAVEKKSSVVSISLTTLMKTLGGGEGRGGRRRGGDRSKILVVSLLPRPTSHSTRCIASLCAGDAIYPVLWEVGLGDSETRILYQLAISSEYLQ